MLDMIPDTDCWGLPLAYHSSTLLWFRSKVDRFTELSALADKTPDEWAAGVRQARDDLGEWITGCLDTWQPVGQPN